MVLFALLRSIPGVKGALSGFDPPDGQGQGQGQGLGTQMTMTFLNEFVIGGTEAEGGGGVAYGSSNTDCCFRASLEIPSGYAEKGDGGRVSCCNRLEDKSF
ncbi:hypothetical protein Dimus_009758 [Dionaea muscipula]